MSDTTRKRRDEVLAYLAVYDYEQTSREFGITVGVLREYKRMNRKEDSPTKKILIFDIETAPIEAYVWGLWKQNVGINQIIQDWTVLCWAAKWLGEDEIITSSAWDSDNVTKVYTAVRDDRQCCEELSVLLSEADIVVAHNGDRFDIKKMNTRFIKHGLKEPTPFKSIDTLKIVKDRFAISSNKLDYVGQFLDIGRKVQHSGFSLWSDVLNGCKEAQSKMLEYNVGDIVLLEQVYLKIRSWDKRHPNVNVQFGERKCPVCGSNNLKPIDDVYTPVSKFSARVCDDCGKYSRTGQHKKTKTEMSLTQRNIC